MAVTWGAVSNKCQVGIEMYYGPNPIDRSTTQVTVYADLYFYTSTYVTDSNNTLTWSNMASGSKTNGVTLNYQTGTHFMKTVAITVPLQYNTTQTKTISISLANLDYAGTTLTATASITIPARMNPLGTISIDKSSGDMGTVFNATVANVTNGYIYSVWENKVNNYGGDVQLNYYQATSTSNIVRSWTPAVSNHAPGIPNSSSGTWTLTCDTMDTNGNYIGSTSVNVTLSVPTSVGPTVGTLTVSDPVTTVSSTVGAYVQTLSKVKADVSGEAGVYGSTISKIEVALGNSYYDVTSSKTWTSDFLSTAGQNTITKRVTDSRGRQSTTQTNINVLPYSAPKITAFTVDRADASFVKYSAGTNGVSTQSSSVQSLVNGSEKNTLTYKIDYRQKGTTTWANKVTFTAGAGIISYTNQTDNVTGPFATDQVWEFMLTVSDRFKSATFVYTMNVEIVPLSISKTGIGVGKLQSNGIGTTGSIDMAGNLYVGGTAAITGALSAGTITENGTALSGRYADLSTFNSVKSVTDAASTEVSYTVPVNGFTGGTIYGRYLKVGRIVHGFIELYGVTCTLTNPTISLPLPVNSASWTSPSFHGVMQKNNMTSVYPLHFQSVGGDMKTLGIYFFSSGGTAATRVGSSHIGTLGSADSIRCTFTYYTS